MAVAAVLLMAGCAAPNAAPIAATAQSRDDAGLPSPHVHAVAIDPADDTLYLATHDGLFHYRAGGPTRVGPVIDLMGFTNAGPRTFYASGHPGPDAGLPNPVGLLITRDAGHSWTPLSRQGESDFHAMTTTPSAVLAADHTLQMTTDGRSWQALPIPLPATTLAAAPDGGTILAATDGGLLRSTAGGDDWVPVEDAPPLELLAWIDEVTAVGLTYEGAMHLSQDAGRTWTPRGRTGPAQALTAGIDRDGSVRIVAVTHTDILESLDHGITFDRWAG